MKTFLKKTTQGQSDHKIDVLIIAGNARSLIANRGDLIRSMRERGLIVEALVPEADYLPEVEELGIKINKINLIRTGTNPVADLRFLAELVKNIRRLKPEAVFSYTIKPVVYGTIAANWAGVRSAYAMITGLGHTYTTNKMKTRIIRKFTNMLYKVAMKKASAVFFQNPDDLKDFLDKGILREKEKAVRINGSGVNLDIYRPTPLPDGALHFVFIGRLLEEKGIREFVEAATSLNGVAPETRFSAVGGHDASLPHAVSTQELEEWKAAGVVSFPGITRDVRPYLRDCSVFVLPSYREGTPRAVLEAMATGRPIITSDAPGCRETVDHGVNGLLVQPRNAKSLEKAMLQYIQDPELIVEHSHASLLLAQEKYDVKKVNQVILENMGF